MKEPNEHTARHTEEPSKNYVLKPVSTPLPSQAVSPKGSSETGVKNKSSLDALLANNSQSPKFRDITEDDDGYHPYADRIEPIPLFEEDPWD